MKLDKLRSKAVRSTRKLDDFVHLSNDELRRVVGGGNKIVGHIDPETCAIHFYYPSDPVD